MVNYLLSCIFLVGAYASYAQPNKERINIIDVYDSSIVTWLLPEIKETTSNEIVAFIEEPSFRPESAFRLIKRDNQFVIEGRFFKKCHWDEIFIYFKNKTNNLPEPEVTSYSVTVSQNFAHKIEMAISEMKVTLKNPNLVTDDGKDHIFRIVSDGTGYIFRFANTEGRFSRKISNPEKDDTEYNLVMHCSQILKDIKNQSFDELKYANKFD